MPSIRSSQYRMLAARILPAFPLPMDENSNVLNRFRVPRSIMRSFAFVPTIFTPGKTGCQRYSDRLPTIRWISSYRPRRKALLCDPAMLGSSGCLPPVHARKNSASVVLPTPGGMEMQSSLIFRSSSRCNALARGSNCFLRGR